MSFARAWDRIMARFRIEPLDPVRSEQDSPNLYFKPLRDFAAPELKSMYVNSLIYTIRPGNERLLELARAWEREGKVVFVASRGNAGRVKGVQ